MPAIERAEDDVLKEFFRERQLNGDLIAKYSDILFQRRAVNYTDAEAGKVAENSKPVEQVFLASKFLFRKCGLKIWLQVNRAVPLKFAQCFGLCSGLSCVCGELGCGKGANMAFLCEQQYST